MNTVIMSGKRQVLLYQYLYQYTFVVPAVTELRSCVKVEVAVLGFPS